jgi:hypothetical protein
MAALGNPPPLPKDLDDETATTVLQMFDLGVTQQVICDELGTPPQKVYEVLIANGRSAVMPSYYKVRKAQERKPRDKDNEVPLISVDVLREEEEVVNELARYPAEKAEAAINRYQNDLGATIIEICLEHEISVKSMYALLRIAGVPLRDGLQKTGRQIRLDRAAQMYIDGATYWEIAQETNVSSFLLNQLIHDRKLPMRKKR